MYRYVVLNLQISIQMYKESRGFFLHEAWVNVCTDSKSDIYHGGGGGAAFFFLIPNPPFQNLCFSIIYQVINLY